MKQAIINFTFCFGCNIGVGVAGNTTFVSDILTLFEQNWHLERGEVLIPNIMQKVLGNDAVFETSNSNLA
jgi:hypothetical protein